MDSLKHFKKDSVAWAVIVLAIAMSLFALYITVHSQKTVSSSLKNFQQTILGIKPINGKDVTVEQIAEAVSNYCNQQNHCEGLQGRNGISIQGPVGPQGPKGIEGIMGAAGLSIVGPKGETGATGPVGADGQTGEAGANGRTLEQRCLVVDQNTRRIEQKYTDDESWSPLYYLSPNQRCPEEVI